MPKGKRVTEELKEQIRGDKLRNPNITHRELAAKYQLNRTTITKLLNHHVLNVIKKSQSQARNIQEITQVDDLLLILADVIFKLQYNHMDAVQARALGYLVKTYFEMLVDRGKVKDPQGRSLSGLTIEELKALADEPVS